MKKLLLILPFLFFFINVNADTISWTSKYSRIYYDDHGTERNYNFLSMPRTHTADYPITQMEYRLGYSGGFSSANTYTFSVDYTPSPDSLYVTGLWFSDGTNRFTDVNCGGWSRTNTGTYTNLCAVSPPVDIPSSGYMYVRIVYQGSYVDSLTSGVGNFSITKGTGAIIQDSAIDIMNNQNELMTTQCSNIFQTTGTWETNNATYSTTENSIIINSQGTTSQVSKVINLDTNSTYKVSFNWTNTVNQQAVVSIYGYNPNQNTIFDNFTSGTSGTYTTTINTGNYSTYKFFVHSNLNGSTNTFTINNIMISKVSSIYCPYGSSTNKLDDVNSSLGDINSSINDDSVSDPDSFITQFSNMLANNGTITQLITLPITMFTNILNNVNGTCSSFNVGNLWGTDLIFPCIDVSAYLGSTLWGVIDVLCSGFFVLVIAKKMIKAFNNFSGMKEGDVINND